MTKVTPARPFTHPSHDCCASLPRPTLSHTRCSARTRVTLARLTIAWGRSVLAHNTIFAQRLDRANASRLLRAAVCPHRGLQQKLLALQTPLGLCRKRPTEIGVHGQLASRSHPPLKSTDRASLDLTFVPSTRSFSCQVLHRLLLVGNHETHWLVMVRGPPAPRNSV